MRLSEPKTVQYDVVLPGAVVADQARLGASLGDAAENLQLGTFFLQGEPAKEPRPSDPATAKRLDELSEQIKELRKIIEDDLAKISSGKK